MAKRFPMMWLRAAALALAFSTPAIADPALSPAPQSSPLATAQPAPQSTPPAAPPAHPKGSSPKDDADSDAARMPKKGDAVVEVNVAQAFNDDSVGNQLEIGVSRVLGYGFQVGVLAGKKWLDYDAQYANISMHSQGLYLTASAPLYQFLLVELRGGVVQDFYNGPQGTIPATFQAQPTPDGTGRAVGVSVVLSFGPLNHTDGSWERQYIGGRRVDIYSVSWVAIGLGKILAG